MYILYLQRWFVMNSRCFFYVLLHYIVRKNETNKIQAVTARFVVPVNSLYLSKEKVSENEDICVALFCAEKCNKKIRFVIGFGTEFVQNMVYDNNADTQQIKQTNKIMKTTFEELRKQFGDYAIANSRAGFKFIDEIVDDLADTCITRIDECVDDDVENNDVILDVLREIYYHGCASGAVSKFIYNKDCIEFYQKYMVEMNEWFDEIQDYLTPNNLFESMQDLPIKMCWFAYEIVAGDVLNGFGDWLEEEKSKEEEVQQ